MEALNQTTALWWAVVVSGIYHGINPGMGWPLAVSAALMDRAETSLFKALGALAIGHLIAMVVILLPFAMLTLLLEWQRTIQIGAALLVIALGFYLIINRRHPRFLARVKPGRLVLWSFLVATAHGAGLMLVPIYLGLNGTMETDAGHAGAAGLMAGSTTTALFVALVHTLAMVGSGAVLALLIYHWLGLRFLSKSWFNLDMVWALSLILVGVLSLAMVH